MKISPPIEIRKDEDGKLDEIVTHVDQYFHLERLSDMHVWLRVGDVHVNLWIDGKELLMLEGFDQ